MKILLVEDHDTVRELMVERLSTRGFEVLFARDGAEAIDLAVSGQPHIILMDMSLPVLNGWQATEAIRANPVTQTIPIVALTAHAVAGERERALQAGCDEYETKPVNFVRLLEKIRALTESHTPLG